MPGASQPLTSLAVGASATVTEIKIPVESRPRLMEMGLLVGTPVEVVRFGLYGNIPPPRHVDPAFEAGAMAEDRK